MTFLLENWLEVTGVISGILCVWLLIKENVLTFPIGIVYAMITVVIVARALLYADVLLNAFYIVMNAYGWYYWLYGGKDLRQSTGDLRPQRITLSPLMLCIGVTGVGSLCMGYLLTHYTQADLAYTDSLTTVASFVAMWMTARKYLESWVAWFVIDVIQIGLYTLKGLNDAPGLFLYSGLYSIYLAMAVWGWLSWRSRLAR